MPTHVTNICVTFHSSPSSNYRGITLHNTDGWATQNTMLYTHYCSRGIKTA